MSWKEVNRVDQRMEFVYMARRPGCNVKELCRRFGISRVTGYKWLARADAALREELPVAASLSDKSRRPHCSPGQTGRDMEQVIVEVRRQYGWGGRKIASYLVNTAGYAASDVPHPSTVNAILKRRGVIDKRLSGQGAAYIRFEHAFPNDLLQLDFKGDFALAGSSTRCYPLTLLDDHSRYCLLLHACSNQQRETVEEHLASVFLRYGLPLRMTMDNGSPWGGGGFKRYTALVAWLMRLGIKVSYSRPYHPQTQGKLERYHRSLKAELITRHSYRWEQFSQCQEAFDQWREVYNTLRPHESLEMKVPASRYRISERRYPAQLPTPESYYAPGDLLRKVDAAGKISFRGREILAGRGFCGHRVALRHGVEDGQWDIFFCAQRITQIDFT